MSHKYLFFVNAEYCYQILNPIKTEIIKRGDQVAWFIWNTSCHQLDQNELQLRTTSDVNTFSPDAVITPSDWLPYYFPGLKIQIFHGIARNKRGSLNESLSDHYKIRGWFDLYCTMAEFDTKKFQELSRKYNNFTVVKTGWPKLDNFFNCPPYEKTQKEIIPTVFFASTFSPSISSAEILYPKIISLCKSLKWKFIVTLHPKMNPAILSLYRDFKHSNYRYIEPGFDIFQPMKDADIMLCDTSSIMYEFMLLKKPLVTYKTKNPGPYLRDFSDSENLEKTLSEVLLDNTTQIQEANILVNSLHDFHDGNSSKRVLDAIESLMQNSNLIKKSKPLNLLRKMKVRLKMRGYK
jgi:CDP-glycerol glycerophosphotransferase (TagB/SpsB family)